MQIAVVQLALIGIGGALGSVLRFAISQLTHRMLPEVLFPVGTLTVNVLGCLAIGLLGGLADLRQVLAPDTRSFVFIGVLGGFTTFSSFAWETLALAQDAGYLKVLANIFAQLTLGLGAAWLGYAAARYVAGTP